MKLNIQEMTNEAGAFADVEWYAGGGASWKDIRDEKFARLIVERCAVECDKEQREWSEFSDGHVAFRETAAKIRNLLEDK